MTLDRVRPNGWPQNSTLTSSEINQIDTNSSNGLDKRLSQSDTVQSDLTLTDGGSMEFESTSSLVISDPASVTVSDGVLAIGAEIVGDESQLDPLRFGIVTVDCTGSSDITLAGDQYNKGIIVLIGTLTSNACLTSSRGITLILLLISASTIIFCFSSLVVNKCL